MMHHRANHKLSPIGFGAFKIGRNQGIKYAQPYELPIEVAAHQLLNGVFDLGVNYVDTAPAYGISEEIIGRSSVHSRDILVFTKVGETFENGQSRFDFSAEGVRASVMRSCERLRNVPLHCVFVHSNGNDLHIINHTDVVATLQQMQSESLVGEIGFSGKTVEGAHAALDWADRIMVEYHLEDRSHEQVIEAAAKRGVSIIVKKGLASGRLDPREAIPFVLANKNVESMVIGGLSLKHFRENLGIAKSARSGF